MLALLSTNLNNFFKRYISVTLISAATSIWNSYIILGNNKSNSYHFIFDKINKIVWTCFNKIYVKISVFVFPSRRQVLKDMLVNVVAKVTNVKPKSVAIRFDKISIRNNTKR